MAYLLQWVMIYSFGINLNLYNGSQWVMIYSFRINTDLGINPNSIPYPVNENVLFLIVKQWLLLDKLLLSYSSFTPSERKRDVAFARMALYPI